MARFMRKGKTRVYFLTTLTVPTAPTAAEVIAGVSLGQHMAEMSGFMFSNNPIMTPELQNAFVSQIPGEDATEASGMVLYQDPAVASQARRAALVKGAVGYVVIFSAGLAGSTPAVADKCDIWPVTVSSNSKQYTVENEAAKYEVKFAMTSPPTEDFAIAA